MTLDLTPDCASIVIYGSTVQNGCTYASNVAYNCVVKRVFSHSFSSKISMPRLLLQATHTPILFFRDGRNFHHHEPFRLRFYIGAYNFYPLLPLKISVGKSSTLTSSSPSTESGLHPAFAGQGSLNTAEHHSLSYRRKHIL